MNILKIPYDSVLDSKLVKIWSNRSDNEWPDEWPAFLKELDKNIIDVKINQSDKMVITSITFENEAYRNWFILRWS